MSVEANNACQREACPSELFQCAATGVRGMVAVNCALARLRVEEIGGQVPCGYQLLEKLGVMHPTGGNQ